MKEKWTLHIIAVMTLVVFIVLGLACASVQLLGSIYAINSDGEMVEAVRGGDQTVIIETTSFPLVARPTVPSGPSAPQRPTPPGNPPSRPLNPTGSGTYQRGGNSYRYTFSNIDELRQVLNLPLDDFSRTNLQERYDNALREIQQYNSNLSAYNDRVVRYNQNVARYEQDMTRFQQENAAYQANLPQLRANVEAEIMSIQNSIYPNAPENWMWYVEGKYLIYEGKLEN
jgi:hypothetical protein